MFHFRKAQKRVRRAVENLLLPLGITLGLPLLLSGTVAFVRPRSLTDWLLSTLLCGGVAVYLHLASPVWFWIGLDWRFLPLGMALAAILWSARFLRSRPLLPPMRPRTLAGLAFRGVVAALIVGMLIDLHLAGLAPADAVDLPFPLDDGRFAVLQGGGSAALNHHRAVPAQAYAIDFVALNDRGRRARGLRPGGAGRLRYLRSGRHRSLRRRRDRDVGRRTRRTHR